VIPFHVLASTDYIERVAIVQGYNTNTYQAQDDPNVPILRRHPSPFTGIDADVEMRVQTSQKDLHVFRIGGRLEHYEPLTPQYQSDDGAVNAAYSSRYLLRPRTFLNFIASGSLATLNGAHIADTTLFAFDPTLVRRTYWITSTEASVTHEVSPTWRVRQALGSALGGTVSQPPTELPNGQQLSHRGVDFAQPYIETDVYKDFSERTTGDVLFMYQYAYNLYVLDLTQNPPQNIGPDKMAFATALVGHTYRWTPELVTNLRVGGVIGSAPPRDVDQRPVISPTVLGEVSYIRPFWQFQVVGGYTYGTVNPRLGAGPTGNGSFVVVGTPSRVGNWKNFSLLVTGQAARSSLLTGVAQSTQLGLYAVDGEFRYAVSTWLGVLGGYQVRYATFDTPGQVIPSFAQHIIFVGLSGYWSTDKNIPVLTQFAAPIAPPT
jgi:hypothetical protein